MLSCLITSRTIEDLLYSPLNLRGAGAACGLVVPAAGQELLQRRWEPIRVILGNLEPRIVHRDLEQQLIAARVEVWP